MKVSEMSTHLSVLIAEHTLQLRQALASCGINVSVVIAQARKGKPAIVARFIALQGEADTL